MLRGMAAKLYVVPASHPCATVERALELKGIPYKKVNLVPVFHKGHQKARFGGAGTVPGIRFDDGRKVMGSKEILRTLEDTPPSLFPADADARRRVEEAETWGDEILQPLVRRVVWCALAARPAAQLSYLPSDEKLFPPTPRFAAKLSGGIVAWAERRINASTDEAVRTDLRSLPEHLDRVDGLIADGVIGGENLNAADLQIATGLRLLLTVDDVQPLVDARPAGELARRVCPDYPGNVPAGALPPAWLPALSSA